MAGDLSAHLVLVHDPADDVIAAGHVADTRDAAIAGAMTSMRHPDGHDPDILACAPGLESRVTLRLGHFRKPPRVVSATPAELQRNQAVFRTFFERMSPGGAAHDRAVQELDGPARAFIASRCWASRSDSEPLLLDSVIDGRRMGGIVSVMGHGGESWGLSIFPNGATFMTVMERDEPGMLPDGTVGCTVHPEAIDQPGADVVSIAYSIRDGEPVPASRLEVALLHVALRAAVEAPPVDSPMAASGTVATAFGEVAYTVFDMYGGQAVLERARATPPPATRAKPRIRFTTAPRELVDQFAVGTDDPVAEHLRSIPRLRTFPVVIVTRSTTDESRELCEAVGGGSYMGVSVIRRAMGTELRLIGLSEPISLGHVATGLSSLRGFMRRREQAHGLHLLVVGAVDSADPDGMFVCILPQPASDLEREPEEITELRASVGTRRTSSSARAGGMSRKGRR